MSNYTPGPWLIREDSCVIVDSVVGYPIAGTRTKRPEDENRANARLISSAPELLEALEEALQTAEFEKHPERPWHAKARAAISKAKGQ